MSSFAVAVHPFSSGNPVLGIIRRGFERLGVDVAPFPEVIPTVGLVLLNWSESLWIDARRASADTSGRRATFLQALATARDRGLPVVWIRHNTVPFTWEGSVEAWDIRITELAGHIDAVIHLHGESERMDAGRPWCHLPSVIIPHPRYDPPEVDVPTVASGPIRRVVLPGGIERRKRHREIVDAALRAGLDVMVAGKPIDASVVRSLRWQSLRRPGRLSVRAAYVSDVEMDSIVMSSRAVLLDQPEQRNSGVVWFALSRGAVVIGVDSPALRAGRDAVGPAWVRILASMNAEEVRRACAVPIPEQTPDLSGLPSDEEFARRVLEFGEASRGRGSR